MTNNYFAHLSIQRLSQYTSEQLQNQSVSSVILALGSNYQADSHLSYVRKALVQLGQLKLSSAFQNPDITATTDQPKPDYINQCVHLILNKSMTINDLKLIFRDMESKCDRQRSPEDRCALKKVTMDIDVLLMKLEPTYNNENSLSKDFGSKWVIVADRYPFKEHEIIGLNELKITYDISAC